MNYAESTERRLEKWKALSQGRTVDLRLNRVGEWSVILNENGGFVAEGFDTFLEIAVTKALAEAAVKT